MKIEITEKAREMILSAMEQEGRTGEGLKLTARRGGPAGVVYGLAFLQDAEVREDDTVLEVNGIRLCVDALSAPLLEEAKIDFVEGEYESGFRVEGPAPPPLEGPIAEAVQKVINEKVNPSIAGHGGFVSLVDVKDKTVFLQFGGGCQGCGMADVTLKQGIEVMIREEVPEVEEVLDITDHAGGRNPYCR
jgi:Fe/S biogenesis protein NfuA